MKYLAKSTISKPDGTYQTIEEAFWFKGQEVDLPQENLNILLGLGVVEAVEQPTEKPTEKTVEKPTETKPITATKNKEV